MEGVSERRIEAAVCEQDSCASCDEILGEAGRRSCATRTGPASRSRRLGGLIRKPPSISQASREVLGHQQIAPDASNPAPCSCANTRASGTPSQLLRMALSGARPPMRASLPSRGPSPVRIGMDRASSASASTKRPQFRRRKPMRRLDLPMGKLLPGLREASPAGRSP
jgi:hypothetical protein